MTIEEATIKDLCDGLAKKLHSFVIAGQYRDEPDAVADFFFKNYGSTMQCLGLCKYLDSCYEKLLDDLWGGSEMNESEFPEDV